MSTPQGLCSVHSYLSGEDVAEARVFQTHNKMQFPYKILINNFFFLPPFLPFTYSVNVFKVSTTMPGTKCTVKKCLDIVPVPVEGGGDRNKWSHK